MDKIEIPPPDEMVWEFEYGGETGHGSTAYETGVKVSYKDHIVTIEVGNDRVRLVEGSNGAKIAGALYAALTMTRRP